MNLIFTVVLLKFAVFGTKNVGTTIEKKVQFREAKTLIFSFSLRDKFEIWIYNPFIFVKITFREEFQQYPSIDPTAKPIPTFTSSDIGPKPPLLMMFG